MANPVMSKDVNLKMRRDEQRSESYANVDEFTEDQKRDLVQSGFYYEGVDHCISTHHFFSYRIKQKLPLI